MLPYFPASETEISYFLGLQTPSQLLSVEYIQCDAGRQESRKWTLNVKTQRFEERSVPENGVVKVHQIKPNPVLLGPHCFPILSTLSQLFLAHQHDGSWAMLNHVPKMWHLLGVGYFFFPFFSPFLSNNNYIPNRNNPHRFD